MEGRHAATTENADQPVLRDKPIISPRNVPDARRALQDFENEKILATEECSLRRYLVREESSSSYL